MYIPTSEWYDLSQTIPPDEFILVKNSYNKIRVACPTYYPFDIINGKITPQENKWDGGWMIQALTLDDRFDAEEITHWATFENEQVKYKLPK